MVGRAGGRRPTPAAAIELSRLNVKVHPCKARTDAQHYSVVFLFAHGAGGTRPRSESKGSMRYVRLLQHLGNAMYPVAVLHVSGPMGPRRRVLCGNGDGEGIKPAAGYVVTFDYPAMDILRYTELHTAVAHEAQARFPGSVLFLSGHSMGCR
jgi:hypothetical protein